MINDAQVADVLAEFLCHGFVLCDDGEPEAPSVDLDAVGVARLLLAKVAEVDEEIGNIGIAGVPLERLAVRGERARDVAALENSGIEGFIVYLKPKGENK